MPAGRRRTARDARRRSLGQNFLVDRRVVERLIRAVEVKPAELVVEPGAGTGALTMALAHAGSYVLAVEGDPVWARRLGEAVARTGVHDRFRSCGPTCDGCLFPPSPIALWPTRRSV